MESILDIRKLLKKYGIFVYTGNRTGDVELMEYEIRELFEAKLIDIEHYKRALLILKKEKGKK